MTDRIERLRSDAAELNVGSAGKRDGLYQAVGAIAMGAGLLLAFTAYQLSLGKDDQRDIQSLIILAVTMLALTVAGAAVFLRYSIARFLRFWLLRQLVEGQDHIDRVVAAVSAPTPPTPPATSADSAGRPSGNEADETRAPLNH